MNISCAACGQICVGSKGLNLHLQTCKESRKSLANIVKRKHAAKERKSARKLARLSQNQTEVENQRAVLREADFSFEDNVSNSIDPPLLSTSGPSESPYCPSPQPTGRVPRIRRAPKRLHDYIPHRSALGGLPSHLRPISPPLRIEVESESSVSLSHNNTLLSQTSDTASSSIASDSNLPSDSFPTYNNAEPNAFGLFRSYLNIPVRDPEDSVDLDSICDAPTFDTQTTHATKSSPWWLDLGRQVVHRAKDSFYPFLNMTTFRLMSWFYSSRSNLKSIGELDHLVHDVILQKDFQPSELIGFSAARETERLDEWTDEEQSTPAFRTDDGWREGSVSFYVPVEGEKFVSMDAAPKYTVTGILYRPIIEIVKQTLTSIVANTFHMVPFKLFLQSPNASDPNSPPERVYSELYNSDAMLHEYEKIKANSPNSDEQTPQLETVIAALMFWSDSTHLAQFGDASLWPIYLFFANQSKYIRGKPSEFAAHHIAYIPSLPSTFQDWYQSKFHHTASAATLTHCKRELMQAIWLLLLDEEFMHAYEHGLIIKFADGISRHVYPRIFTYSADYPEKVLLATLKYLARCPCPRCLVEKSQISDIGSKIDIKRRTTAARVDSESRQSSVKRAQMWIFEKGKRLGSVWIKNLLDPYSWTPTKNAFSTRLSRFGFNFYQLFVVDLLHEFELGVWKAVFTHLLRLLYAAGTTDSGESHITLLNQRYRLVPTFARDTIRRFHRNISAMKQMAARDWEDVLQCALPVFEGLMPLPYDNIIQDLLYTLCTWHAYAKLRIHTESTIKSFEEVTSLLGATLQRFQSKVCLEFDTKELPREEAARGRRKAAQAQQTKASTSSKGKARAGVPHMKKFGMSTYKLHALGDYPSSIRFVGTADNYSTQPGELEHRRVKRYYSRTNKNFHYVRQIAKQQRREEIICRIHQKITALSQVSDSVHPTSSTTKESNSNAAGTVPAAQVKSSKSASLSFLDNDPLPYTKPDVHHHMSLSNRFSENIIDWCRANQSDPACRDFYPKLKDHLLSRVLGKDWDGEEAVFSPKERDALVIEDNKIYRHKVLRINYTTYDLRRAQDSVNPRAHADIMMLAHEDADQPNAHPYWYARIIGIFHTFVRHLDFPHQPPQRIKFLWIRWFGRDASFCAGLKARRLPRIGFVDVDDLEPFGFLDPHHVLRGVHLIPAFNHGTTDDLLGPSIARSPQDNDEDWKYYYVNIFVDRDMFMRFRGGGVGHRLTTTITDNEPTNDLPTSEPMTHDELEDTSLLGEAEVILPVPGPLPTEAELEQDEPDGIAPEDGSEHDDEEKDYGYQDEEEDLEDQGDNPTGDDSNDENDLGPEDGEEGFGDDDDELEGYGTL